jgi:hypothetical protein
MILIPQHLLQVLERKGPLFYNPTPEISHNADRLKPSRARAETTRARLGDWIRKLGVDDPEGQSTHAWAHLMIADRAGIAEKISDAITGHAQQPLGAPMASPAVEDTARALEKFPRYEVGETEDSLGSRAVEKAV